MGNATASISRAIDDICGISLDDAFSFERVKVAHLQHPHMHYTGTQVSLMARFGKTKTHVQVDLGFGDIIEPIVRSIDLTSTQKGPLFESQLEVHCYPKEFIFAEKLETVIYRGSTNSRMKDFHDLYSLVSLPYCLNPEYIEKVVTSVFKHRQASIEQLPVTFDPEAMVQLQSLWQSYHQELINTDLLPLALKEVITTVNNWLKANTKLVRNQVHPR